MDLNKPLFYKSSNPQLAEIIQLATNLFYWDESANMPIEIQNGEGVMAPQDIEGDYIIWSDSYTLGFTSEADARPIFFSDGGQGADKILRMINSVANRLGVTMFADLNTALAWAASEPRIYIDGSYEASSPVGVCDPSVTNNYSGGNGPGNIASSLLRINRAVYEFNGPAIDPFNTSKLTATKACTLENLEAAFAGYPSVTSTNWSDTTTNPHSYHAWTTNLGWNAIPVVGDVIYRDADGAQYFGQGGFLFQDTTYPAHSDGRGLIWVTVGANGVVTDVEPLAYLNEL